MSLPLIGITTGDPAGIGPEVAVRALLQSPLREEARVALLGDRAVMEDIVKRLQLDVTFRFVERKEFNALPFMDFPADQITVLDCQSLSVPVELSLPSAEGGKASYQYIQDSINLAKSGILSAVVTAPINKLALKLASVNIPGHTEIFGEATKANPYAMMMYSQRLAVGLVTCHQSLASVPESLSAERIATVGRLLIQSVERIRGVRPRLAVLGLNPHAGEMGLFGTEERRMVAPAIEILRSEGFDVAGPLPPDTAFTPKALQEYGAHLCLYHDQGLIPFKMISFDDGVNVTMGLPFPRTSVDHGTAYDIAGLGVADYHSMVEAVRLAIRLVGTAVA